MGKVPINLAPVWKKRSYKLKYWNNLATILQASSVCKTISRIKKTMNHEWNVGNETQKNKYDTHRNMYSHEEVLNKLSRNSREQVRTWLADIIFAPRLNYLTYPFTPKDSMTYILLYGGVTAFLATITTIKSLGKTINVS